MSGWQKSRRCRDERRRGGDKQDRQRERGREMGDCLGMEVALGQGRARGAGH